ncbi:MAG: cupin domain-containing protein [Candidatus Competibacteraceae bacterium]|nr:cupin domain-containing protein [Candidatus Competibacteraceae bacterium]
MNPIKQLLGGLSPAQFITEYWQKKPLLIRNAWPEFQDPFTPEEIAGLACESEVEARLIQEIQGKWQVRHSPFQEEDFLTLPDTHWTLLVQDAEKHAPDLATLLEPFRFIPDWRIDDLMISYAPQYGSVGPHVDDYDVFLLQGQGQRRWQINTQPATTENLLPDSEMRILRDFHAEQEWVLKGGDMLYLPPRIAHYGVALEPCLTYSIGFRAPSHAGLVSSFADYVLEHLDSKARYTDPDLTTQDNPGEIASASVAKCKALLNRHLNSTDDNINDWFGRYMTEPKPLFGASPASPPVSDIELRTYLAQGGALERNPGSRFAYVKQGNQTKLFIDGQAFTLGALLGFMAPLLCRYRVLTQAVLFPVIQQSAAFDLLLEWVNEGYWVIYEDE